MGRLTALQRLEGHDAGVWAACWAGSSSKLLSGSLDETVKVWEQTPDALRFLHTYEGHTLGVVSVAVHSGGDVAASSSLDSVIRVWNLNTHETLSLIETAATETWSITFGPQTDALHLATAGGSRGAVVLWSVGASAGQETAMQAELQLPQPTDDRSKARDRFVLSVAYSPDGRRLACGAIDGTVAVFDVATAKPIAVLEGHYKPVRSLAFTPDSKLLLTACDDMHVNMYDVEGGGLVESFSGHDSWVLSVAPHPNGTSFVSGGSDAKVKLWDLGTRTCAQTSTEHTDQVWAVAFNGDGTRLVSAADDKAIVTYGCA